MWTKELIQYWCERYYELREYELLPFESSYSIKGVPILAGSHISQSPYEETCDLNWEFDAALRKLGKGGKDYYPKALTKLGERGKIFKEVYLDGGEETEESKQIYNEFCKILIG